MMPSIHLIFCLPLLLTPSIFPNIRVFSNESALHIRWPKYWSFSISPSSEYCNKRYVDVVSVLKYLNTLKVFLTLSKHSPHTVAVAFAACGVTPELTQIIFFFLLHNCTRRFILTIALATSACDFFPFPWIAERFHLFTERKPFRASLWKNPICRHHYSCTLGPLLRKRRVKITSTAVVKQWAW